MCTLESSSSNNAQRMETDLISKPNPTLTPMENSTPTTKTKGVTRKSALQQTPVTQVPMSPYLSFAWLLVHVDYVNAWFELIK